MKILPALLFAVFLSAAAAGEKMATLKLTDGTELHEVEIKAVTAAGVRISHRDGGGLIPPDNLPPSLKAKVETLAAEQERQRLVDEGKRHELLAKEKARKAAALPPLALRCQAVKEKGEGGFLSDGRFRYFIAFSNNATLATTGRLVVSTENGEGVVNEGAAFDVTVQPGGVKSGFFNMHTAPPVRHGSAGVIKLQWKFTSSAGIESNGSCEVPNRIGGE